MTIANNFASKLAVAFVAVAMIFSAFATSANAQTTEELQAMINELLAQVASLQSDLGSGSGSSASVCPYTWTRDLSSGSTGSDVMKLQQFLNADPDTRVAAAGSVGSAGMETEYYGPATAAAVSNFQVKYRSEVLSPYNLVNPTGYFGPSSRGKANGLCASAPSTDDDDDDMIEDDDDDDFDGELSGEASLDQMEIDSASDDDMEEGAEDAEIGEITVEFTDGDAEISRIDIALTTDTDADVWDVFESISLWVDGDKVAEENADDEDDYLDEDDGTLRFSGLDIIGMEDEEVEIVIAATIQNNLDSDDLGTYMVSVEALRFFDADGVATTEDEGFDFDDTVSFEIEEEGAEDELIVKTSSNDPDATTLQVEDDSKSDWFTVFVFDLDTDDSVNDIEINEIKLNVEVSSSTFALIVDDAELTIDGVTIDDYTASATAGSDGATSTLTFDVDGDVTIDAGDRVEAELQLRFKSLAAGNEGITVSAEITSAQADLIDAEGADDLSASQLSGAASGDAHTLRTAGADISVVSVDAEKTTGPDDANPDDYGTYEIKVEVTAFEQDVYIAINPATSVSYTLEDTVGSTSIAGTRSVTLTSTADDDGTYFEITEGETETLTLKVVYTPGVAGTVSRLVMNSISFAPTAVAPTQTQTTLPAKDYRTTDLTMTN